MGAKSVGWERRGWQRWKEAAKKMAVKRRGEQRAEQNGKMYQPGSPDVADSRTRLHLVCTLSSTSSCVRPPSPNRSALSPNSNTHTWISSEKWEEERQQDMLLPLNRHTLTITKDITTNPVSYNAAGGALILGFRLLFPRGPGLGEGDYLLSERTGASEQNQPHIGAGYESVQLA